MKKPCEPIGPNSASSSADHLSAEKSFTQLGSRGWSARLDIRFWPFRNAFELDRPRARPAAALSHPTVTRVHTYKMHFPPKQRTVSALERPHPALRNTKQRRRPARQQAPPAATAPLAARPTTHPTCPQSSTARVSGRSTAAERHAGSRTVHFDVPDLELRGDRGTPFEGLVHRVHSNVKLSLFLLAALRAIAWRNSPALALGSGAWCQRMRTFRLLQVPV